MDRVTFLDRIYASRTRLDALLTRLSPEQMTQPALPGGWTVKDLLAHLGWWEQRVLQLYQESIQNGQPAYDITDDEVDALNARMVEEYRPRDLDEVRDFETQAYNAVLALVETAPEADLFEPGRFAWTSGRPFADYIDWNTFGHYDEHSVELQALLPDETPLALPVRRAGEFLEREGRDIEQVIFDFAFRGAPAAGVLDALAAYQTPDGGFTRLEVDIEAPVSNPFADELALRVLSWIDPPRDHPLVTRLVAHLEETQDEDGCWKFAPEVYQGALAPWFQGWKWPNLNPSGQIAGTLKFLGLGSDRLHSRVERLFETLANPADLTGEYYSVLPYALYYQTNWENPAAELYRWGVVWWLIGRHIDGEPVIDSTHFMELLLRPDGPIARRLPEGILSARLTQLEAEQSEDGGWPSPYSAAWRPWITMQNLLVLKAYGRLA